MTRVWCHDGRKNRAVLLSITLAITNSSSPPFNLLGCHWRDTEISVCVGRQSLCFLSLDKWPKKNLDSTNNVGKTAGRKSGGDAQRASLFHTLKSDTMLSTVSRGTPESDYSHTDNTCCATSERLSVTVEENTAKIILLFSSFCFQRIQGQNNKNKIMFRLLHYFFFLLCEAEFVRSQLLGLRHVRANEQVEKPQWRSGDLWWLWRWRRPCWRSHWRRTANKSKSKSRRRVGGRQQDKRFFKRDCFHVMSCWGETHTRKVPRPAKTYTVAQSVKRGKLVKNMLATTFEGH